MESDGLQYVRFSDVNTKEYTATLGAVFVATAFPYKNEAKLHGIINYLKSDASAKPICENLHKNLLLINKYWNLAVRLSFSFSMLILNWKEKSEAGNRVTINAVLQALAELREITYKPKLRENVHHSVIIIPEVRITTTDPFINDNGEKIFNGYADYAMAEAFGSYKSKVLAAKSSETEILFGNTNTNLSMFCEAKKTERVSDGFPQAAAMALAFAWKKQQSVLLVF
jgi:hypothetical protein